MTEDDDFFYYAVDLRNCYREWFHGHTPAYCAARHGLEVVFCALVYAALDRRWPGMARRVPADPVARCIATVPDFF